MILLSIFVIALYIIYAIIDKGIPISLSSTYYDYSWIFSFIITLSSSLIFPSMLSVTPENYQFLAFITFAGVLFVAFAPNFKTDTLIDNVHTIAAIITLIASQLWVALINPIYLLWWIPVIIYILVGLFKKISILKLPGIKFWSEVVMLLTIYNNLLNK